MIFIKIEVINPFLNEEDTIDIFNEFGFNLRKDLKYNSLNQNDFISILLDAERSIEECKFGNRLYARGDISAYKLRVKDCKNKFGASGGFRFVYILILGESGLAIPFHIYHKHSGKKSKTDLTMKEKSQIKKLIDSIYEDEEDN